MRKSIKKRRDDKLWREHARELARVFGKKRADNANLGWGQDDDAISSKVYASKKSEVCEILTSTIGTDGKVRHGISEY